MFGRCAKGKPVPDFAYRVLVKNARWLFRVVAPPKVSEIEESVPFSREGSEEDKSHC
jgi:hypothetical protein